MLKHEAEPNPGPKLARYNFGPIWQRVLAEGLVRVHATERLVAGAGFEPTTFGL